jgi:hypothetical protein
LSGTESLGAVPMDGVTQDWLDQELAGSSFADERLGKRLRKLVELMGNAIGSTVPLACQDWANTKAAYRFFSNERVSEAEILAGHFEATRDRFAARKDRSLSSRTRASSFSSASTPRRSASHIR